MRLSDRLTDGISARLSDSSACVRPRFLYASLLHGLLDSLWLIIGLVNLVAWSFLAQPLPSSLRLNGSSISRRRKSTKAGEPPATSWSVLTAVTLLYLARLCLGVSGLSVSTLGISELRSEPSRFHLVYQLR